MLATELQQPTDKKLTLTGKDGIYSYLSARANERIKNSVLKTTDLKDDEIAVLIRDYNKITEWIYNMPEAEQEDYLIIPKQIRAEALGIFIKCSEVNESQMSALRFKANDILFERALNSEASEYIILSLLEYDFLMDELRKTAEGGKFIINPKMRDLKDDYRAIRDTEKMLIASQFPTRAKAKLKPEKQYDIRGNEIEPEPEPVRLNRGEMPKDTPQPDGKPITLRDCPALMRNIRKQIREEKRKLAKEFSDPKNLCYNLLYELKIEFLEDSYKISTIEPPDKIYEKIEKLGKSSLKNLLSLIIRLINEHYSPHIIDYRKYKAKMNRQQQNKKTPPLEKRELIQMGKAEGMKQTEVAKQLACSIRTVKGYWN